MKFRTVIAAFTALMLVGCVKAEGTYQEQLNQRIERAITAKSAGPTYSHGIYSFYVEPSIGRISSEETSNVFVQDGVKFVMNLNVSSIVNARYYDAQNAFYVPDGLELAAESEGTFTDYAGEEHPFSVSLYRMEGDIFTYAKTDLLEFFSISNDLQALQTAETMIRIARTVRVDHDAVIAAYSSRQEIEYERKRLELFQNVVPENGVIDELFEGNGNYAGVIDNYAGDNIGENTMDGGTIDSSMGDADDQIGEPFREDEQLPGETVPDAEELPEDNSGGESAGDTIG